MKHKMTAVIASRQIETTDGKKNIIHVEIGKPENKKFGKGVCSYCTFQITTSEGVQVYPAYGADSIQALYCALRLAGVIVARLANSDPVTLGFPDI